MSATEKAQARYHSNHVCKFDQVTDFFVKGKWPKGFSNLEAPWNQDDIGDLIDVLLRQLAVLEEGKPLSEECHANSINAYLHEVWLGESGVDKYDESMNTTEVIDGLFEAKDEERFETVRNMLSKHFQDEEQMVRLSQKLVNIYDAIVFVFGKELEHDTEAFVPLTEEYVKTVHKYIGTNLIDNAGGYRDRKVTPSGSFLGISSPYAPPSHISTRMSVLLEATNTEMKKARKDYFERRKHNMNSEELRQSISRVLAIASVFFSDFLLIHPFLNGNGRVARLLMNHFLKGITVVPFTFGVLNDNSVTNREMREKYKVAREKYLMALETRNNPQYPPYLIAYLLLRSLLDVLNTL